MSDGDAEPVAETPGLTAEQFGDKTVYRVEPDPISWDAPFSSQ